jgi:filamentous hemagglutinin
MPWENYLASELPAGSRLPPNFKTFDFYDPSTGTAISAKTLDMTTAAKVGNPSQVYSSLKGNIDAVARFETYTLSNVPLDSSMITARELRVAVPGGTNSVQWVQINRAIKYGQSQGVKIIIISVK